MNKALLVGINAYPGRPLNGCLNDIKNMSIFLVQEYGFSPDSIKMLADGRATKTAIMDALVWLCDVKAGDRIVFHYSGHGTQVADSTGTEVDGLSECICPVDFDWHPDHYITDKELVDLFSKIPAGVKFNWISDSCHSGDLDRGLVKTAGTTRDQSRDHPKFIEPPMDIAWKLDIARSKAITANKSKAISGGVLDVGFVSGCRSDQTSADAYINGSYNGALTYFFLKNLKGMKEMPLAKVVASTRDDLKAHGYSQEPQADGSQVTTPFCSTTQSGRSLLLQAGKKKRWYWPFSWFGW